jgi:nitrite reductase/ring-hydroxylating ferredoxin subunit
MTASPVRAAAIVRKDLEDLCARRFRFRHHGRWHEGLLVRRADRYYAYLNECRHIPVSLDLSGGDFFSHDRRYLQCSSHGALYEVDSGLCVQGPCQGERLQPLVVQEAGDRLLIQVPEGFHAAGP